MKKMIGICFFSVFFLLCIFGVYLLWRPETEEMPSNEQLAIETETEYTEYEAAESMSLQKTYVYRILEKDGCLVVCGSDGEEVLFETNIQFEDLDKEMQERIREGIGFMDEGELYDFLESYSS